MILSCLESYPPPSPPPPLFSSPSLFSIAAKSNRFPFSPSLSLTFPFSLGFPNNSLYSEEMPTHRKLPLVLRGAQPKRGIEYVEGDSFYPDFGVNDIPL